MTREEHSAWLAEIELADWYQILAIRQLLRDTERNTRRWRSLDRAARLRERQLQLARINMAAAKAKLAELGGSYIRDRLRETSFARKILPPHPLQPIIDLLSNSPITPVVTTPEMTMVNTEAAREAACQSVQRALQTLLRGKPK